MFLEESNFIINGINFYQGMKLRSKLKDKESRRISWKLKKNWETQNGGSYNDIGDVLDY